MSANGQRNNVDTVVIKGVIFGKALSSSLVSVCVRVFLCLRETREIVRLKKKRRCEVAAPTIGIRAQGGVLHARWRMARGEARWQCYSASGRRCDPARRRWRCDVAT
jgi:hypothetical protein